MLALFGEKCLRAEFLRKDVDELDNEFISSFEISHNFYSFALIRFPKYLNDVAVSTIPTSYLSNNLLFSIFWKNLRYRALFH